MLFSIAKSPCVNSVDERTTCFWLLELVTENELKTEQYPNLIGPFVCVAMACRANVILQFAWQNVSKIGFRLPVQVLKRKYWKKVGIKAFYFYLMLS